jgi:hypothetical protein
MMQNPDRPAGDLVAKFMRGYYGPAAGCMKDYLDYLEKRIAESPKPTGWDYLDLPFFVKVNALLDKAEMALSASDSLYSLHVRQERVPVDIALLHLWEKLASRIPGNQAMPFNRNGVIERYAKNRGDVIRDYYGGERLKESRAKLAYEIKFFKAMPIPLPEQFAGMKVVADLLWPDFTPPSSNVDDPIATAGAAHRLGPNKDDKTFHDRPLAMGLYDSTKASEKSGPSITVKPEEIPQDGKYHIYKVGRFLPGKRALLWAHWSWHIQLYLRKANCPPVEEEVDVYVSMKVLGPAYIKGSKDENSIFIDRVILVAVPKE